MFNQDQELEKLYHPENFDCSIEQAEAEAEKEFKVNELKKQLFKELYGTMISIKYCELDDEELANTALGVITLFKNKYLGYTKGAELSQLN